jgi:SAM-dependent methyltransferase
MALFALIHGAGGSAAQWGRVAAALREHGHDAVAMDLPCEDDSAGLSAYSDAVIEAIADRRDVVLVAHSLAGFTAPLVCERVPVDLMILVAAMVPAPGETGIDWWANTGHAELEPVEAPVQPRGQSRTPMLEPWPLERWPDVPTEYVLCRDDRIFPAEWARRHVRERLGIVPDEIDGGHSPFEERPLELAARLLQHRADERARRIATESGGGADPTAWFERLYAAAAEGETVVPWDRGAPHPLVAEWAEGVSGDGRRALVVGAGFGADAELLSGLGFDTVAFDIAPTAVRAARERVPGSAVDYRVADLLDPPAEWRGGFDLVVEVFTVQALPDEVRPRAIANVGELVAPGGTLLVVAAAREERDGPVAGPPWPLTGAEVDAFAAPGLRRERVERSDGRWRAEFRRGE